MTGNIKRKGSQPQTRKAATVERLLSKSGLHRKNGCLLWELVVGAGEWSRGGSWDLFQVNEDRQHRDQLGYNVRAHPQHIKHSFLQERFSNRVNTTKKTKKRKKEKNKSYREGGIRKEGSQKVQSHEEKKGGAVKQAQCNCEVQQHGSPPPALLAGSQ